MRFRAKRTPFTAIAVLLLASTLHAGSQLTATRAALATPKPAATQVGLSVLRSGGNAIDAAVAVAFALAVEQPQSGNIGGGGYLLYYDAASKGVWTLDFREAAPAAASAQLLTDARKVRSTVTAAAVPGTLAGLGAMHAKFGSKPWKELVRPAITLATEGIRVDDDLALRLQSAKSDRAIDQNASTASLFFPDSKPAASGDRIVLADLAATLTRIAEAGAKDFYQGDLASKFVDALHGVGGVVTAKDLLDYAPVWRAPLRFRLGDDDIYAVGPPSAAGMELGIALNILGGFDLVSTGYDTPQTIHIIAEAQRRAALDAAKYIGDPSTTRIPYRDLLSGDRAAGWRRSIWIDRVTPTATLAEAGSPVEVNEHGTTFVVSDAAGNIAALTMTLGEPFGSGVVVPGLGFFVNNSLEDFADPALPILNNSIAAGKRPADSTSPVIVLRKGKPFLAFGTGGQSGVAATNLEILLNVLVFDQPLGDAVAAPRFDQRNAQDQLDYEHSLVSQDILNALGTIGHGVASRDSIGNVEALMFEGGRIVAVADPRHAGAAGGL